jgi:glutathione S-transferase
MTILKKLELSCSKDVWFFDNKINMIDICILPFIRQFRIADTNWFDALEEIPEIQGWLNRFLESKLLKNIMINYNTWEPENKKEFFPYKPIES